MNEKALQNLYGALESKYKLGTFDEFKDYLSNERNRRVLFKDVIKPNFKVESQEDFETAYGLKKKKILRNLLLLFKKKMWSWIQVSTWIPLVLRLYRRKLLIQLQTQHEKQI